jgi:hypothetical protein
VHIHPDVAGAIELNRLPGCEQERRRGLTIGAAGGGDVVDRAPETGQGVAEVCVGGSGGSLRPQHLGQEVAALRPVCFHSQIGQQHPGLFGFEAGDRFVIQGHPH